MSSTIPFSTVHLSTWLQCAAAGWDNPSSGQMQICLANEWFDKDPFFYMIQTHYLLLIARSKKVLFNYIDFH